MITANGLKDLVVKYLNLQGHAAWRQVNTTVRGRVNIVHKGVGDVMCVCKGNGRHLEVEIKVDKDEQSDDQKKHQKWIEDRGGVYVVARDFDEFVQWYNKHRREL